MKASRLVKAVCALGIISACIFALSACSDTDNQNNDNQIAGLTGGVAAMVNGTEISEDTITTYIQNYRTSDNMSDEETWGKWLADYDYTPESVREEIINFYVGRELVKQAAAEEEVEVPSSEIDEYVNKMKAYYETDEQWQEALQGAGFTEEGYRNEVELALLEGKVQDAVAPSEEVTDEEIVEYAQQNYNGAKRSSHILFDSEDQATAQEVLDKINTGELDFAEAAKEYSSDGSAENGGDVGWDRLNSFVTEYTEALAVLEKDQVSGLVTSEYGIHIIKCTAVLEIPEGSTDISLVPEEFIETIKTSLETQKKNEAYTTWYNEYKEAADIVINDMPENVPYNVDVSKYKTEEDSSGDEGATGDGTDGTDGTTGDGSAEGTTTPEGQTEDPLD